MTSYGDALAAEALLFAILGVVFSVWYPELVGAINTVVPQHIEDVTAGDRAAVRVALRFKAIPLLAVDLLILLIFVPDAVRVVYEACHHFADLGINALSHYDSVQAALVAITMLEFLFALMIGVLVSQLRNVKRRQEGK
jgi:hypothetical protein